MTNSVPASQMVAIPLVSEGIAVHNPLLALMESNNKFQESDMSLASVESNAVVLLTNLEGKLSRDGEAEVSAYQADMIGIQNDPPGGSLSSQTAMDEMTTDNTGVSIAEQTMTANTTTVGGLASAFQSALTMVMNALSSMSSMYDQMASKMSFDASLMR